MLLTKSLTDEKKQNLTDYNSWESEYTTAKTPWVTSQPVDRTGFESGVNNNRLNIHSKVQNLFKFYSLSEGDVGNNIRIKINITKRGNNEVSNIRLKTDTVLSFFGLIMKLGPIAEWGLNMNKKTIEVNSENFETNKKGIFAAGDICSYPGKLKLILSGFHEVALASVECFKRARPNEKYRFEFTTSSKNIQNRLGKK